MPMPGRSYQSLNGYRYGFNGKENDNEVKGTGNQQDYGMRISDPRLGRFLSVDPLQKEFAWNSSYAFAENDVIRSIDLDGAEKNFVIQYKDKSGTMLWHTVPYSKVHPGVQNGPLGKGDYIYAKDPKTGQFSGHYVKTYKEANPIRSALQNADRAYEGENGLKKAAEDYPNSAKAVAVVGIIYGAISTAFGNPAGPEIVAGSLSLYEVADAVSNTATIVEAGVDLKNKNYKAGAAKIGSVATDYLGGKLVPEITQGDKVLEAVGTVATDQVNEVISDKVIESVEPK